MMYEMSIPDEEPLPAQREFAMSLVDGLGREEASLINF